MQWCPDNDGDGWGAAAGCQMSPGPIAGHVDNADDCDDTHDQTHPGAAQFEPRLCARDADQDRWGDDSPPAGVDPGSDCDDEHARTHPGAAPNEADPAACARDDDEDDWADASPGPGIVGGADCYDTNASLNPGAQLLTALFSGEGGPVPPRTMATIDPTNALVSQVLTIEDPMGANPNVNMGSATLASDGTILVSDTIGAQLLSLDYQGICAMGIGQVAVQGMPHGQPGVLDDLICGLQHGPGGLLYGISLSDELHTLDPATGQITSSVDLLLAGESLDIFSCGMAYDCVNEALLVMNGLDAMLYEVQVDGTATPRLDMTVAGLQGLLPTGLEYDPVGQQVYISTGGQLWSSPLDGTNDFDFVGFFGLPVPNLQYLPVCN